MEVCGTHTMAIAKAGIKRLLPPGVELGSGPGCPVCVTPPELMDAALELASRPGVTVASYGGPGSKGPGNGAARNYDAWQKVFVNMDTICSNATPDTSFKLFGREFGLPIFPAPIGALPMHYSDRR